MNLSTDALVDLLCEDEAAAVALLCPEPCWVPLFEGLMRGVEALNYAHVLAEIGQRHAALEIIEMMLGPACVRPNPSPNSASSPPTAWPLGPAVLA